MVRGGACIQTLASLASGALDFRTPKNYLEPWSQTAIIEELFNKSTRDLRLRYLQPVVCQEPLRKIIRHITRTQQTNLRQTIQLHRTITIPNSWESKTYIPTLHQRQGHKS